MKGRIRWLVSGKCSERTDLFAGRRSLPSCLGSLQLGVSSVSPWHVPSFCQGCACRVCLWEIVLMLDSCSRVSCLRKELLVCLSPVLCSARLEGGSLCFQMSQGKAVLLLLQGREDKAGALSWQGVGPQDTSSCRGGGAIATQALCSSSRREMEGTSALPASQAPHHSSLLFLPGPRLPLPSHADLVSWITQIPPQPPPWCARDLF